MGSGPPMRYLENTGGRRPRMSPASRRDEAMRPCPPTVSCSRADESLPSADGHSTDANSVLLLPTMRGSAAGQDFLGFGFRRSGQVLHSHLFRNRAGSLTPADPPASDTLALDGEDFVHPQSP